LNKIKVEIFKTYLVPPDVTLTLLSQPGSFYATGKNKISFYEAILI
jgi:hypothetical protein